MRTARKVNHHQGHRQGHLDLNHAHHQDQAHRLPLHQGQGLDQGHHQGQKEKEVGSPGQGNSRVTLVKVKRSLSIYILFFYMIYMYSKQRVSNDSQVSKCLHTGP